jgi:hypothetical protein
MGEGARVDEDRIGPLPRFVDGIDQFPFVIRLQEAQRGALVGGVFRKEGFDIGQRVPAVDLRLAGTEQIEIWAVQDEDAAHYRVIHTVVRPACQERSTISKQSFYGSMSCPRIDLTAGSGTSSVTNTSPTSRKSTKFSLPAAIFLSACMAERSASPDNPAGICTGKLR